MNLEEFMQKLTEEQEAQFDTLSTAAEILSFAKELGLDLDEDSLLSALNELPEDDLDGVSGGRRLPRYDMRLPTRDE